MSLNNLPRHRQYNAYVPALTETTNVAASIAGIMKYSISGKLVEVSGVINVDPTAGSTYTIEIELPFGVDITDAEDVSGIAVSDTALDTGASRIVGDATNNTAKIIRAGNTATAAHDVTVQFSYIKR